MSRTALGILVGSVRATARTLPSQTFGTLLPNNPQQEAHTDTVDWDLVSWGLHYQEGQGLSTRHR